MLIHASSPPTITAEIIAEAMFAVILKPDPTKNTSAPAVTMIPANGKLLFPMGRRVVSPSDASMAAIMKEIQNVVAGFCSSAVISDTANKNFHPYFFSCYLCFCITLVFKTPTKNG